jgi:RimJ/RimL family protein N-acetyltransferase
MDATPTLAEQLRRLRLRGALAEARALIRAQPRFAETPALRSLLYEHEDFWWAPIAGRRAVLRRRDARDVELVRACWADADFMRRFNRAARPLPVQDAELAGILAREHAGILSEAKALHWTIHTPAGAIGFVSATDYSPAHRRAEFLIGVLRQAPGLAQMEAAYLATDFLEKRAGIERLTAYFYAENTRAAEVARKFGFEREGVLRGYVRGGDGRRGDLVVAGMLLVGERPPQVRRTRDRILGVGWRGEKAIRN